MAVNDRQSECSGTGRGDTTLEMSVLSSDCTSTNDSNCQNPSIPKKKVVIIQSEGNSTCTFSMFRSQLIPALREKFTPSPQNSKGISQDAKVDKKIQTTTPSQRKRYDLGIKIPTKDADWQLYPCASLYIKMPEDTDVWKRYQHPEGNPYFEHKVDEYHYLTEANVDDKDTDKMLGEFIDEIQKKREFFADKMELPKTADVYLELTDEGRSYYMVDLEKRRIFWLDKYDATWMADQIAGIDSWSHLHYHFEYEFWVHVEHFPHHHEVMAGLHKKIKSIAIYATVDMMTSNDSTAPYGPDEWHKYTQLLDHMDLLSNESQTQNPDRGHAIAASARLMSILMQERFWNFHGHIGARLTRDQSVRGPVPTGGSWIATILGPLLFFAHATYLSDLEKMWIDGTIKEGQWMRFVERLQKEWDKDLIIATVLLAVNVSFLAIQVSSSPNQQQLWSSPAGLISQVSTIASIASIICGTLMRRQHDRHPTKSVDEAAQFLACRSHPKAGLERLAVTYCLPHVTAMWGVVFFICSLATATLENVSGREGDDQRYMNTASWAFAAIITGYILLIDWQARYKVNFRELFKKFRLWWQKKRHHDKPPKKRKQEALHVPRNICKSTLHGSAMPGHEELVSAQESSQTREPQSSAKSDAIDNASEAAYQIFIRQKYLKEWKERLNKGKNKQLARQDTRDWKC